MMPQELVEIYFGIFNGQSLLTTRHVLIRKRAVVRRLRGCVAGLVKVLHIIIRSSVAAHPIVQFTVIKWQTSQPPSVPPKR